MWDRSLGWEDPLEEGVATHSGTLAWTSPWTQEPGRLRSTVSHRVGHNSAHTHILFTNVNKVKGLIV